MSDGADGALGDSLAIWDPRAGPAAPITSYDLAIDLSRPGLRIALVSNGFYDATNLLNAVGEELAKQLISPRIALTDRRDPSAPGSPELIAKIAQDADIAIAAMGHCGSCTAGATRDAINLARAGVPACALVNEKFLQTSDFVARAAGMPGIPRIRLPHPVAGAGAARIAAIAKDAVPAILASWTGRLQAAAA